MDIEILLALQEFRGMTEKVLAPFMDRITKLSVSVWPVIMLLMFYWAFNRKTGRRMLFGMSLSFLVNGLMKLIFCAYRPWIRDPRIEPYGDSKVAATGYSFPSGHSMMAMATFGTMGIHIRKRYRFPAIACFAIVLLTMFSRVYLGVHTPQDILVGPVQTVVMVLCAYKIEDWSDRNPDRNDMIILIAGLAVCIGEIVFLSLKSYPMDYLADGTLIVDPKKMLPDTYEGIGFVSSYVVCRYFERRGFDFDNELPWKDRFIIGAVCCLPLIFWYNNIVSICASLGSKSAGKFLWTSGIIVWTMIGVPAIMKKIAEKKSPDSCDSQDADPQ